MYTLLISFFDKFRRINSSLTNYSVNSGSNFGEFNFNDVIKKILIYKKFYIFTLNFKYFNL